MNLPNNSLINSRIQSYLRFAASQQRDTKQIGSFLATCNRHNANPFLNYAIPDDDATPSLDNVNALIDVYKQWERKPRLEYVANLAPAVADVLISAGFAVEGRLPLMICEPGSEHFLPIPSGVEIVAPTSDAEILSTVMVQNEAYGAPPPSPEDAQRLKNSVKAGAIALLARVVLTGESVGAGVCSISGNQTTEIAGIGVRTPFRRRGIAGALTTRLVQEAFNAGVTMTFLMAAHKEEERIYSRAGFAKVGEILHISLSR